MSLRDAVRQDWRAAMDEAVARDVLHVPPSVYFLYCQGLVKIGTAVDVAARVQALRTSNGGALEPHGLNPSRAHLIGTTPGGRRAEMVLHQTFRRYRVEGEWFLLVSDLADEIERMVGYPIASRVRHARVHAPHEAADARATWLRRRA